MHPTKRLLQELARQSREAVESTGDTDPSQAAATLERALAAAPDRHRLMVGLADYLVASLDGAPPHLESWSPVEPE